MPFLPNQLCCCFASSPTPSRCQINFAAMYGNVGLPWKKGGKTSTSKLKVSKNYVLACSQQERIPRPSGISTRKNTRATVIRNRNIHMTQNIPEYSQNIDPVQHAFCFTESIKNVLRCQTTMHYFLWSIIHCKNSWKFYNETFLHQKMTLC